MTKKLLNRGANAKNVSVKGFGVTTSKLEIFFTSNGETTKSQFVGVFPANKKGGNFIKFSNDLKGNKTSYLFMIANTNLEKKPGVHWWSFLDNEEKILCFYSICSLVTDYCILLWKTICQHSIS